MSFVEVAFAVPCRTCGAPLRLDLARGSAHCAYCRSDAAFARETLDRVQQHRAEIARLEIEAAGATAEADYQRQRRRLGWGWLQPLFPLLTGLYVIFGLGVGGSSRFVVDPFLTRYVGQSAAGFAGAIAADRAGATQSEQTLGAVIPNQLLVIAFAIVVSIVVGLAKLLFHF